MPRRPPLRRAKKIETIIDEEPRMLSSEEKRELILAHAAAREPKSTWGFGYMVGIAASCLVVVSGWWWTLGTNLRTDINPAPSAQTQELRNSLEKWRALTASSTEAESASQASLKARIEALKEHFHQELIKAHVSSTASKP